LCRLKLNGLEYYLLFAAYLILFAWLVTKVKFFRRSGFTSSQLVILFLLKVMAGIFYGWIGIYYGQMAQMIDTWAYHIESLQEYRLLQQHPTEFFTNLFHTTYKGGFSNFFYTHNSWWNDVKASFFIKIMALFNVFSFGNYYVNVIFYSFLSLFGPMAIYRVMKDVFPGRNLAVLIATFLCPSFLYWTSGLHKEGLIFTGLSMIIYHFYFGFKEKRFSFFRILIILFSLSYMMILRNYLLLPLLPPLIAWILASSLRFRPALVFTVVMLASVGFFFTARYINPGLDLPKATVTKQQEFIKIGGGSSVAVKELKPTFGSFVRNTPQALTLAAVRPYPSDVRHLLSLAAALEIAVILLFFLLFLFWRKNGTALSPFLLFCIFFSFGVLIMIGYTVNNLGAIVRYRSIVFPLLLAPMAAKINWNRIGQILFANIKNNNN
jgi:hypothetical protein